MYILNSKVFVIISVHRIAHINLSMRSNIPKYNSNYLNITDILYKTIYLLYVLLFQHQFIV